MKLCASTLRGLDGRGNRKLLRDRHTNTHTRHTSHTHHTHKTTTATLTAHVCQGLIMDKKLTLLTLILAGD